MAYPQFDQFLREVLKLPMAVFEGPSFGYTEQASRTCFAQQVRAHLPPRVILVNLWLVWRRRCGGIVSLLNLTSPPQKKVSLNTFLDTLMSDPPPQCLVWLPLMHRLANVENGKTQRGIFRNGRAGRGLGGCKVQPCIIILTHHAHKQPSRHIQGNTYTHTHTHLQWWWPIGTLHPAYECVLVRILWCSHHHKSPPSEQEKHIHGALERCGFVRSKWDEFCCQSGLDRTSVLKLIGN